MQNKVKLLKNDMILVQKTNVQTKKSMLELYKNIQILVKDLRGRGKPVLILSDARKEDVMDKEARKIALKIGEELDYYKSASFGSPTYIRSLRELLIIDTDLDKKVANFETRAQAEKWLRK